MKLKKASEIRGVSPINLEVELNRIAERIENIKKTQDYIYWGDSNSELSSMVIKKLKEYEYDVEFYSSSKNGILVFRISW